MVTYAIVQMIMPPAKSASAIQQSYIADFSLALINRTGAYYVCRDVVQNLPHFFKSIRYWRFPLKMEPKGNVRKIMGRAMLLELQHLHGINSAPRARFLQPAEPILFFDPLYVLRSRLKREDIVLCHDVGPISHPELFSPDVTKLYMKAYRTIHAMKPGVVFVSEASKHEFVTRYGSEYRFLRVIPLYVRSSLIDGDEKAPPGIKAPFFLTVAGLEVRKNHRRVMEAFTSLNLAAQGYSYVFCGPRGNSASEIYGIASKLSGVHGFGYLSDAELRWLYRRSSGFILPSLLEGFGVPALEAAQYGLLSIVNAEGAQREAVGEGGIFVDPLSVQSIAGGMKELMAMPETERLRRLRLAQDHAAALSQETYISRWSELLAEAHTLK